MELKLFLLNWTMNRRFKKQLFLHFNAFNSNRSQQEHIQKSQDQNLHKLGRVSFSCKSARNSTKIQNIVQNIKEHRCFPCDTFKAADSCVLVFLLQRWPSGREDGFSCSLWKVAGLVGPLCCDGEMKEEDEEEGLISQEGANKPKEERPAATTINLLSSQSFFSLIPPFSFFSSSARLPFYVLLCSLSPFSTFLSLQSSVPCLYFSFLSSSLQTSFTSTPGRYGLRRHGFIGIFSFGWLDAALRLRLQLQWGSWWGKRRGRLSNLPIFPLNGAEFSYLHEAGFFRCSRQTDTSDRWGLNWGQCVRTMSASKGFYKTHLCSLFRSEFFKNSFAMLTFEPQMR